MSRLDEAFRFAVEELATLEPEAPLDRLELDTDLTGLALDSVTVLSLVAALEDRYGTRIPDQALLRVRTMSDLLALALDGAEAS
ncbi:MAG TPA: acyl carrier protein [Solirubrobacterales bacterium]|nr:acyl carrier protein [Solirubrobacterales bacterium]